MYCCAPPSPGPNWTPQTGHHHNRVRRAPHIPRDAGLLFNIPQPPPRVVKGAIHCPALLQNPGSVLKQDVCLRPPSPQINNPQNLISGGRVEVLESHYFHIPYPGAPGLLRECGRLGAGPARACGGNLRPCARLQGETGSGPGGGVPWPDRLGEGVEEGDRGAC